MAKHQQFKGPVSNVAANDLHVHHYWPDSAPPDDSAMSLQCWQCKRLTWRYTPMCVHCGVKLRRSVFLHWLRAQLVRWR